MKYLIKYKDGSVGVMTTVSDDTRPEDEMEKWTEEHKKSVESHRTLDESEMPEDRYFRDAWIDKEGKLHVDLDKSLAIHQNVLRELRKPKLEALDVEATIATEEGDAQRYARIVNDKKELRDITAHPELLSAQTPEAIKNFRPAVLFG